VNAFLMADGIVNVHGSTAGYHKAVFYSVIDEEL
jgi:hypothetical protein